MQLLLPKLGLFLAWFLSATYSLARSNDGLVTITSNEKHQKRTKYCLGIEKYFQCIQGTFIYIFSFSFSSSLSFQPRCEIYVSSKQVKNSNDSLTLIKSTEKHQMRTKYCLGKEKYFQCIQGTFIYIFPFSFSSSFRFIGQTENINGIFPLK